MNKPLDNNTKKRILILSYHFPPMNVIASQRALGYANHMKKFGFEPTILTFDWSKKVEDQFCSKDEFDKRIQVEDNETHQVIRIPIIRKGVLSWMSSKEGSYIYKLWILWSYLTGKLDVRPLVLAFAESEWHYLSKYVNKGDYDMVMGIFSPHFHLRNCWKLNKRQGIPYALDFRDLWYNRIIHEDFNPGKLERFQDKYIAKYWKKWTRNAKLLSITSRPWADKLTQVSGMETSVILNGFNRDEYLGVKSITSDKFVILHTGSLYHHQDFNVFINGVKKFEDEIKPKDFEIVFLGAIRSTYSSSSLSSFLSEDNLSELKKIGKYVRMTRRVDRHEVIRQMMNATVLYIPTFPKSPGTYGGKIFEYLATGKPIIAIPEDKGVISEMLKHTKSGRVFDDHDEFALYLKETYLSWKQKGGLNDSALLLNDKVMFYSRENQTKKWAEKAVQFI